MLSLFAPLLATAGPVSVMVVGGWFATRSARPENQLTHATDTPQTVALDYGEPFTPWGQLTHAQRLNQRSAQRQGLNPFQAATAMEITS